MSVYYVYILETESSAGKTSYYTGYTNNLLRRVKEHKNGTGAKYCRGKKRISLKYFETYTSRREAMNRELEIKTFTHQQKHELVREFEES